MRRGDVQAYRFRIIFRDVKDSDNDDNKKCSNISRIIVSNSCWCCGISSDCDLMLS